MAAVRTQLAEGEVSTMEANLAEIEAGRARGRVLATRREETSTALDLKELLGLTPDRPIQLVADGGGTPVAAGDAPTPPPLLAEDSLVALALARRPDLTARMAAVRESEVLTTLARRSAFPNLRLGAVLERGELDGSPRIGPAIGLSLPLFNRHQGLVDQRLALAAQARLDQRATALRIRADVVEAVRAYRSASEETAHYEASVLRPARDNIALLEIAYREGKISLPTLLLLRNQLLDAEFGYWDAWLAQREALVRLETATGARTPSAESLPHLAPDSADRTVPTDSSSWTSP
jgi:cobalt-zinc-cadmium efflux system outer membrane protein